jgi:hypothetical protein
VVGGLSLLAGRELVVVAKGSGAERSIGGLSLLAGEELVVVAKGSGVERSIGELSLLAGEELVVRLGVMDMWWLFECEHPPSPSSSLILRKEFA